VLIRYIELQNGTLLLCPHNQLFPLILITAGIDDPLPADQIIARICHVSREL
jgi:hypothetical protein